MGFVQELFGTTASGSATSWTVTLPTTPSSSNRVYLFARASVQNRRIVPPITDSKGNTWTTLALGALVNVFNCWMAWTDQDVAPLVSGDVITMTMNSSNATGPFVNLHEWSGVGALQSGSIVTDSTTAGTTADLGNLTEAAGNFIFSVIGHSSTGTTTQPSGFTTRGTTNAGGPLPSDMVAGSSGTPDISWTFSSSSVWSGIAAAFAASGVVATGSISLSGTAAASTAGSGSLSLGGTTAGSTAATGSLSLGGTAATTDTASGSVSLSGSGTQSDKATGSVTLSGTGTATTGGAGATGALSLAGTGTSTAEPSGSGSLSLTGTSTGYAQLSANGTVTLSGSALGQGYGTATGFLTLLGTSTASLPAAGTGSITLAGTAVVSVPRDIVITIAGFSVSRITLASISGTRLTVGAFQD